MTVDPVRVAALHLASTDPAVAELNRLPVGSVVSFQRGAGFTAKTENAIKRGRTHWQQVHVRELNRHVHGALLPTVYDLADLAGTGEASNFGLVAEGPERPGDKLRHSVVLLGLPEGAVVEAALSTGKTLTYTHRGNQWVEDTGFVVEDPSFMQGMMGLDSVLRLRSL